MKHIPRLALLLVSGVAGAAVNSNEIRIRGAAAEELFESLKIEEVFVQDEHGGPEFAVAKYGKKIGCQRDLRDGSFECWIFND